VVETQRELSCWHAVQRGRKRRPGVPLANWTCDKTCFELDKYLQFSFVSPVTFSAILDVRYSGLIVLWIVVSVMGGF